MNSRALYILLAMAAIAALAWLAITRISDRTSSYALRDYVERPDSSTALRPYGRAMDGATELVELRLDSQTWHDVLWKHRLFVIKPDNLVTEQQALLVLGGGRWRPEYDREPARYRMPDDAELFLRMAESLETVVVVLDLVPYQPLFGMTEDMLIAYTLEQYLDSGEPDWPLLLPMVKSAVRAMDAAQQVARDEWSAELAHFTVIGGSKRGWTAWLTAAVDARVNAVAPIVIDALNMAEHFPYQTEVWGRPSEAIRPYTDRNLHVILASEEGRALREIIDPYAYRSVLRQPKLIINATNDQYFPLDSLNLYWRGLVGEKYALYLPNETHNVEDYLRVIAGVNALNRRAAGLTSLPDLEWEFQADDERLRLCVRADPAPERMRVWRADSADRDFRDEIWRLQRIEAHAGVFEYDEPVPSQGYVAVIGEADFGTGDNAYSLSTTPAVLDSAGGVPGAPMSSEGRVCAASG